VTLLSRRYDVLVITAGLALLAVRNVSWSASAMTVALGAVALAIPVAPETARRAVWCACVAAGCSAVVFVRIRSSLPMPRYGALAVAATIAAAIAEEAFFRRVLYAKLERFGPAVAIVVSATGFAVVHLPNYGVGVMPIDFAAGLLFGWQRWATGSWTAPAATHVVANLVQMW
jgi:membrane protease YdiL (CAAX protease family)